MTCNHTTHLRRWVETGCWSEDTMATGEWVWETHNTTEDIDLHRYRCTQCGQIRYYSSAAQEYYETGVDRKGLFE